MKAHKQGANLSNLPGDLVHFWAENPIFRASAGFVDI
jgi:hypothetical protein